MSLSKHEIADIIERLQNGEVIPDDYKYKIFPIKQKEYELVYGGKMRREDILANEDGVHPVPLQVEKIFNGQRQQWKDGWRNMIAFGDNLQFLKTIYENKDPLIKNKVKGKVKLIYIDPPFATEADFKNRVGDKAYTDKIKGAEFVEFLRRRLIVAREILSDDGNIIVHMDNKKIHYSKIMLDEILGEGNYINEIIWHKGREGGSSRSHSPSSSMPTEYQNILIYSKNRKQRFWNPILGPYKESTIKNIQKDKEGWFYTRGRMGRTPAEWEIEAGVGLKSYVSNDISKTKEEIIKNITGIGAEFVAIGDVWNNEMVKFSQVTDYPTEKPEGLLKLLIKAATNEGDIVLDFFGGSGTTAVVAEKLNRKWITCDIGKLAFYTIQKRFLNIESSKSIENSKKLYGRPSKCFLTVNTGHYNLENVFKLHQQEALTHGMRYSRTYRIWCMMKTRCLNKNNHKYKDYGARGITICNEWIYFENFLKDMGECPKGLSIDRINNDKGYYKENCKWSTNKEQANNSRHVHYIEYKGKKQSIKLWSEELNINYDTLKTKIRRGFSLQEVICQ